MDDTVRHFPGATVDPVAQDHPATPSARDSSAASHAAAGDGKGRSEKVYDWGRFNHLVEHFVLIYGTDTVWDGSTRTIMKISAMAHAHGADYVKMWKASDSRRTVLQTDVVFDPTCTCDAERCVNLFGGLMLRPAELPESALAASVKPMLQLIRHLCDRAGETADEADAVMHWLMCWMAYPLQHVGAKLRTAVVMHGDEGAGKNFLFETLVMIYGQYGASVGQDELEDKFNDYRSCKLFLVGDEVSSAQELVHNKNRLKALITSPTVQINPKNLPRRQEANHINVCFLSNEIRPLALDNSDRRYLVIFTPPALEREFYRGLGEWRRDDGLQAWYQYLLSYPVADFDPFAPAPVTEAKRDLIDLSLKTPERFWIEWQSGELGLPYWSCSVDQAYRAFGRYCTRVGERFPVHKSVFSRMVCRVADSRGKPCCIKTMAPKVAGIERATRVLLVAQPPDGSQGEWAAAAITAFDKALRTYLGADPHSPEQASPERSP